MALKQAFIFAGVLSVTACRSGEAPSPKDAVSEAPGESSAACGRLRCQHFADTASAVRAALVNHPRVVAFGESHVLRGAENVVPATERFGADLLPLLALAGARALVVELINPPTGCEAEKAAVQEVQKPIVQRQDDENQGRFVQLGHQARALGLVPLILEPTCEEFGLVRQAGADGVSALLELITRQTQAKLDRLAVRAGPEEVVLAYGGALHNDIAAPGETKPFAFGAALSRATEGRYVAIDLIVPEFVGASEAWKALPWYEHWPQIAARGVTLIQTKPNEYTIIMERGRTRAPETSKSTPDATAVPLIKP